MQEKGRVRKLNRESSYGFIKGSDGDYFFHKSDFTGDWDDLCDDYAGNIFVEVVFTAESTARGLRAREVKLVKAS